VSRIKIIEVISGLGLGGAEMSLVTRLRYQPKNFTTKVFNLRPQLRGIESPVGVQEVSFSSNQFTLIFRLAKELSKEKPDIVVARTPLDLIRICIVSTILRKRSWLIVFEAHSKFITERKIFEKPILFLYKYCASQVDLTLAVSRSVMNGPLCIAHRNTVLHYLGADIEVDVKTLEEQYAPRLLFIGRLVKVKNPLGLIEAINQLNCKSELPRQLVTVVGDGPLRDDISNRINRYHLQPVVSLLGAQKNIRGLLAKHSHLISCSFSEGLPITFFEAKLAGMRIITTPSGGGSEILDSRDTLLQDFSQEQLEKKILEILQEGAVDSLERRETCLKSQWMHASRTSRRYYRILTETLSTHRGTSLQP
jgi:glycosyltransferase involved in cell wall biosynthesis